ncbi:RNA-directed DNA polymerase, eukaryota [Tanacetum coccineum]
MEARPQTQATPSLVASPLRMSTHVGGRCSQLSLMVKMFHLTPESGTHDKHYPIRAKETTPPGLPTTVNHSSNEELRLVDEAIDKGSGTDEVVQKRVQVLNSLRKIDQMHVMDMAQKTKIKWSIEGDENSSFFHGMLNKKRNQTNIRGIMVDGVWKDHPSDIKKEFLLHFQNRFDKPAERRAIIEMCYPRLLSSEQRDEIEREVTKEELKTAVWDCGTDKSSGPNGYTFGFYRKFWSIIENDVYAAVKHFFNHGDIPAGCNASFIALIPKIPDANLVKDFRPISLIGSTYKIIAKILANRLVVVLGDIVNEVQSAFIAGRQILDGPFILNEVLHWCNKKKKKSLIFKVDFEKAYDSVRWDFLDDVLKKFGFGNKWCNWIQCCLKSSRGSILVNGSPTEEFQFFKGLKQGDPLSPFLFILIMESLHLSFQRVIDAGLFKGINLNHSLCLSHMFYADDAVFVGQWSDGNINTLIHVLDCFYHASGLRINMRKSKIMGAPKWEKLCRVSKRGRRLLRRVPSRVLHVLESIRGHFFNGHEMGSNKATWVKWNYVLTDKKHGGLVSSLYALNRGLMIKWVWRFFTQKESLWAKVITAIHGDYDKVESRCHAVGRSCWLSIVNEVRILKNKGMNIFDFMNLKLGNGDTTRFWTDRWYAGGIIKDLCPRLFALDNCKEISLDSLAEVVRSINLVSSADRWIWNLESSGEFSVASARKKIDEIRFPIVKDATRWVKCVPIKVNILAWKIRNDALPTRFNISRKGIDIQSIYCPICENGVESSEHLFFKCYLIREIGCKIASSWNINYVEVNSYGEWKTWLISCRMESKLKQMFEGVCCCLAEIIDLDTSSEEIDYESSDYRGPPNMDTYQMSIKTREQDLWSEDTPNYGLCRRGRLAGEADFTFLCILVFWSLCNEIIVLSSDSSDDDRKGPSKASVPIFEGPSVQGLLDYYGYNDIEEYLSWNYFPSTDKENTDKDITDKDTTDEDCIHECNYAMSKDKAKGKRKVSYGS